MTCYSFFDVVDKVLGLPALFLFLLTGIVLTFKTGFIQFRSFSRFMKILTQGPRTENEVQGKTISPYKALFTAMSATMGMGGIVTPTVAILVGGPGALFWFIAYGLVGCVTKYSEVCLALRTRENISGAILGGPVVYLKHVGAWLGSWYAFATIFLFAGWSGVQARSLSDMLNKEGIPLWVTGLLLAGFVLFVVLGGVSRVGSFAEKIIPIKFTVFIVCACFILLSHPTALFAGIWQMFYYAFSPCALLGGALGVSILSAMRNGVQKAVYVTECGIGTASIVHSYSDIKNPSDQGILAMYSVFADLFICLLSGLMALTTGAWMGCSFTFTIPQQIFRSEIPYVGSYILITIIAFSVLTATISNTFNGSRSFAFFSRFSLMKAYYVFAAIIIFLGATMDVKLVWDIMCDIVYLVAIPNMIGVLLLAWKKPEWLK
jgi:AGCS family alanine or glycine:cation symporter